MTDQDVRWKQRLENFEKAFELLKEPVAKTDISVLERAGLIKFYEMAFELSWKLMKDYLDVLGFSVASPRQAIKQAYQSGLIDDGHDWIAALDDRNMMVHTYNQDMAVKVETAIREKYYPLLSSFYARMLEEESK